MTAVLGISAEYHDAAAALVVDGQVIAAMQEERFSRKKNDPSLPLHAARACLQLGGYRAEDLDAVVFYENPYAKLERVLVGSLDAYPHAGMGFGRALASQLSGKVWVLDRLAEKLGVSRKRVTHGEHHRSHAASVFYTSPFERAAVLTVDAVGEEASTVLWLGEGSSLRELASIDYPHSLGLLYAALTAYLGFEVNEGEFKVMGLSAFGSPRYLREFERILRLESHGAYSVDPCYLAVSGESDVGFSPELERMLGPRRLPHLPWDLHRTEDQRYADIACSLQLAVERALVHLAREAKRRTNAEALCLAGGVALNAVANARILREAGFSRVYVTPAAGDAGGALGAALEHAIKLGASRPRPLESAAFGLEPNPAEALALARALGLEVEPCSPARATVEALQAGGVVAFCQGRFEWGPRALGQRSLLAPAHDPSMKDRLNRVIKRREPFRPFAPAVLAKDASAMFGGAPNDMTPFMTTVCSVHETARDKLAAAIHVDGTARVQTVDDASAPELAAVLSTYERDAVLNTSLNSAGEPICASAADALAFFVRHPVDVLIFGDLRITDPMRRVHPSAA